MTVELLERRYARVAVLCALIAFGCALRLLGIRFGLPFHHHWDEVWVADSAAGMIRHGDDMPGSFQYGAPLAELTKAGFRLLQRVRHENDPLSELEAQATLYWIARVVTALISTSGIPAIYLAARWSERAHSQRTPIALGSTLLYASSSSLVLHSRYGVTDACLVGLTAWTLAFAGAYVATRKIGWALASLLFAGLTFSFKVTGLLTSIIPIAALLLLRTPPREALPHRLLLLAAIPLLVGCYVALNPHVVDKSQEAAAEILNRIAQTRNGGASAVYVKRPGLPHLAAALAAISTAFLHRNPVVALVLMGVSVVGLAASLRRRRALVALALLHATVLTLVIALPNRAFWVRNYIPVIPCLCLGFGVALADGLDALGRASWMKPRRARDLRLGAFGATAVLLIALPLNDAIRNEQLSADTRTQALEWIATRTPAEGVDVGLTSTVFGKRGLATYDSLVTIVPHERLRFSSPDLEACPEAKGPQYIVDASYRDTHKADSKDAYGPVWLFKTCPGYQEVAHFDPNPYEHDSTAPTWQGRIDVIVLERESSPPQ